MWQQNAQQSVFVCKESCDPQKPPPHTQTERQEVKEGQKAGRQKWRGANDAGGAKGETDGQRKQAVRGNLLECQRREEPRVKPIVEERPGNTRHTRKKNGYQLRAKPQRRGSDGLPEKFQTKEKREARLKKRVFVKQAEQKGSVTC